jgi:hypothetical protein
MPFIKSIPQGNIYSVYETLCYDLDDDDKVQGCYRNLEELLISLASFYLSGFSGQTLTWFGDENTFFISLGGDGAPFGKNDTSCAWLVGILNTGRGILSSNENYLLFGANCPENCVPVQRYIKLLLADIKRIEKGTFTCTYSGTDGPVTVDVKFRVGELPNDMKMICFLSGEFSNSAKFFSSFANISDDNANDVKGTFGTEKQNTWQPWKYSSRLSVAKSVEALKKEIAKQKLSDSTKRSRVTTYIAKAKSRQEFIPPFGPLIDRIHVDPLHLKNNACALSHRYLLDEVLLISNISSNVKSFSQLQSTSAFAKYVHTMKTKCQMSRLANKIMKWFNECRSDGKRFDYRFTGKDSRLFLHNFMFLIAAVNPSAQAGSKEEYMLHVLAYTCLTLRSCVSLFCRIDISDEQLVELDQHCRKYFLLHCIFFSASHNPTSWTLGNVVPVHAKQMKSKYKMGLALNSMEGREAKHISIAKYSKNTNYKARWEQIFLHEFVSLLWLRERGYNITKPAAAKTYCPTYIPKRALANPDYCFCGLDKETNVDSCKFCLHSFRGTIIDKVNKAEKRGKKA